MTFEELLAKYPRICVAGPPRTGKTTYTSKVSDRPVIHTDDWMDWPWRDVPELVAQECAKHDSFVVEGVRAPDAMRRGGLEVDAVLWLATPKTTQTEAQRSMGVGVHTVLAQWAEAHPDVPIINEDQMTLTLDHAQLPQRTRRYAVFTLDFAGIQRTPQGGLRIPARVSKAGVFKYQRGNRVLREYRPASELRRPEALASLKGAPVVVLHPDENGGAVDTDNHQRLSVGHFEDPWFNEDALAIDGWVVVNHAETIARIESGELADISSAYDNGRDFNPGFSPDREPYDLVQTDYVFNHVALGPPGWGRQGPDVGLLTLDADDNQVAALPQKPEEAMTKKQDESRTPNQSKGKTQDAQEPPAAGAPPPAAASGEGEPTKTEDEALELTAEDIAAFKKVCAMLPALNRLINTGSGQPPPTAEGGPPPPASEDTGHEEQRTMDAADIERIAQEGVEVRSEAIGVLGSEYSPKGKSTRQVRLDVIRTFDSKFSGEGKSDDAIASAYAIALHAGAERKKHADELAKTRRAGHRTLDGGADETPRKPIGHQAYDAWKN